MHPDITGRDGSDREWDVSVSKTELESLMSTLSPTLQKLSRLAFDVYLWTIIAREPVKRITNGRICVIGDAAHPHLPHHGQGASSALEDASSLAIFLRGQTKEEVEKRLRDWEAFRFPRAAAVQTISTNFPKGREELEPRIRGFYQGPLPENFDAHQDPTDFFLHGYDVQKAGEEAVGRLDAK